MIIYLLDISKTHPGAFYHNLETYILGNWIWQKSSWQFIALSLEIYSEKTFDCTIVVRTRTHLRITTVFDNMCNINKNHYEIWPLKQRVVTILLRSVKHRPWPTCNYHTHTAPATIGQSAINDQPMPTNETLCTYPHRLQIKTLIQCNGLDLNGSVKHVELFWTKPWTCNLSGFIEYIFQAGCLNGQI